MRGFVQVWKCSKKCKRDIDSMDYTGNIYISMLCELGVTSFSSAAPSAEALLVKKLGVRPSRLGRNVYTIYS